jgi:hypothetical protein
MPRYDYGVPNEPGALTNWAADLLGKMQGSYTWGGGIQPDFRIIEGEHAHFARFEFANRQGDRLLWDLLPGPSSQFGRTLMTYHAGGSLSGVSPEVFIGPDPEGQPELSFSTPTEALSRYVNLSLSDPMLREIYPKSAMKRLGLLLYRGASMGLPVAGGLVGYNLYHTEQFVNQMAASVSVGIHPDIADRSKAMQAIYNAASSFALQQPSGVWSALQTYVPGKSTGDILRLHHVRAAALVGERGQYSMAQVALSTQAKSAIEQAPAEFLKRERISGTLREQATLYGYEQERGVYPMEPDYITGPFAQAGHKYLNILESGSTERLKAYVRPGFAFTPASPVPGLGILYGPESLPEEALMTGVPSHHEQVLPPVGIQNIPGMQMEFGIFKRRTVGEDIQYERMRKLPGARLDPHQSAIIGLMRFQTSAGEQLTQEIAYRAGATPTAFTGLPTLKVPTQYRQATGEGQGGFGEFPAVLESSPIVAAARRKFGIPAWAEEKAVEPYLHFPTMFGVHPSLKGMGVKMGVQQLETPTGIPSSQVAPLVEVGGTPIDVTGVSGEMKAPLSQFKYAVFGSAWPERQIGMAGEIAMMPGASRARIAMSEALQGYLRNIHGGVVPGAVNPDVVGQIYAAYTGTPFHPQTSTNRLFQIMKTAVERLPPEVGWEKYGHAKIGPSWFPTVMTGAEGYHAWAKYAKPGTARFSTERTQGIVEPLGTGPMGYLEYKSPALLSTLTAPFTPEYQTNVPLLGYEERASIQEQFPETAQLMGIGLAAGQEGVLETGYGYQRPEVGGWSQISELARSLQLKKGRFGAIRPVGAIDLTQELSEALRAALSTASPKELNLGVIEEAINSIYGEGQQVLWNPRTNQPMLRASAIQATATAKFPQESPFYNEISMLKSSYPYALEQWIEGWDTPQDPYTEAQQAAGMRTPLTSFYRDVSQIFTSQSREVEKMLQSLTMAGMKGGRFGFSMAAGVSGAVMRGSQSDVLLRNLSMQAGLTGESRSDFMRVASEQLREGPLAAMFWRFPMLMKPGGVIPTNLVTTDFLRRSGIHYPEERTARGGQVSPGSIFATNLPFMIGLHWLPHIADLDLDPGQLMALGRASRAGIITPQDPKLISALAQGQSRTLAQWEQTLSQAAGTGRGGVPGGQFNILAEAMGDIASKDIPEPALIDVPRENWWKAGVDTIQSKMGMGMEYNMRRMFEASAATLGYSGEAIGIGHTASALRYQEFLDKLATQMKTTTTMLYTSHFAPKRVTGDWQLNALMGQGGAWVETMTNFHGGGRGSWGNFVTYASTAIQRDIDVQMRERNLTRFNNAYPSFLMAMGEEHIPVLSEMIDRAGTVIGGMREYRPWLKERGMEYDPTRTVFGLGMVASAVAKGEPWGDRPRRTVISQTSRGAVSQPTFEAEVFSGQSMMFQGEDIDLSALPANPTIQAMEATYGFLTRKWPVTMVQSGQLYGLSRDMLAAGGEIPLPWQGILSRYPAAQESALVAQTLAQRQMGMVGSLERQLWWLSPEAQLNKFGYTVPYVNLRTISTGQSQGGMQELLRWFRKGRYNPNLPPGAATGAPAMPDKEDGYNAYGNMGKYIVGEDGPEILVFTSPGSIYPANMARANAIGLTPNMGNWATELAKASKQGTRGAATGAPGMVDPNMLAGVLQQQQAGVYSLQQAPFFQQIFETQNLALQNMLQQELKIKLEQTRGYPGYTQGSMLRRLGTGLVGVEALRQTTTNIEAELGQALGIDPAKMPAIPENLIGTAMQEGRMGELTEFVGQREGQIRTLAKRWRQAESIQFMMKSGEAQLLLGGDPGTPAGQRLSALQAFFDAEGGLEGGARQGRLASVLEQVAIPGGRGRRRGFAGVAADIPAEALGDFTAHLEKASEAIKGFYDTIEAEGPESRAGKAALQGIAQKRGGIQRRMLGMQIPIMAERSQEAWARYEATGDPQDLMGAVEAEQAGLQAYGQYRTAGAAERGGIRAGTQASRFMRGLIGGWGLMYMGHLAQFPMQQAQYGFAEAEAFQTQMAAYGGGMLGPGVQPFPSIQGQMLESQLMYGGQGFGAMQLAQANLSPATRDLTGMGLAGAAGGALSLYFGSVATTAGLETLGASFAAAAPWAAGVGALGYGLLQTRAWRQQPQQTMATTVGARLQPEIGYRGGAGGPTIGDLLNRATYTLREQWGMTPEQQQQGRALTEILGAYAGGEQPFMASGRSDASLLSLIPDELMPVAAQVFAAGQLPGQREGLDPTLRGQAFLRIGRSASMEQIEDVVWAQMRGIDTPTLAGGLLRAGRQPLTEQAQAALETRIESRVPDMFAAAELQAGTQIMGSLPVNLLKTMYGENYATVKNAQNLAPWARSDMASLLNQEGQLQSRADLFGLTRSRTNIATLERVKRGDASPQEIRALSVAQARETRAGSIATQIGYYAPEFAQGAFTSAQASAQADGMWQSAAAGMAQSSMLGISAGRFLGQMTGQGIQGNLLGQQALGMTQQYAMWGGQQTSQFFGAVSSDLGSQIFAQRLMRMDPFAFAEASQAGVPGMAQFATTVDIGLGGDITGLPWGTTSLARVGRSAESVANQVWGNQWQGTGWGEAAVRGITTPFGQRVAGARGLQWHMRGLQYEQQQASLGVAAAQIALQEEYMPQFWAVQDQQRALGHEQRMFGFDMQQRQFNLQGQQFTAQMGLQRRGQLMQRGFAMQDWAWQDQTRAMQWAWRQEDFAENVRFMSGRERRLAERGMERETIMFGMEGERIDEQRSRQKEMWALEDARFDMQKKHFNETRQLQEENMDKQKEFYLEGKKLQDEMIKLQREYQMKQLELQKASIGVQAEYAQKMKEAQDAMVALGDEQEDNNARWKLAQTRQVELINTIIDGVNHIIEHAPDAFASILDGNGQKIPGFTPKGGNGGGSNKGGNVPMATGGPSMPGRYTVVGDAGMELVKSSVPQHVFPSNETFAAMLGGAENMLNDPWAQTVVSTLGGGSAGARTPTTVVINIGNERLGEFVLSTVNNALEVR